MQLEIDNPHSGNELLPIVICPLMMKRMIIIDKGRELHQVRLSPTMKSTIINIDIRVHLVKAWEMTP